MFSRFLGIIPVMQYFLQPIDWIWIKKFDCFYEEFFFAVCGIIFMESIT